jgi:Tat protein secretion system quality control protein TatD with DNase activity
LADALRARQREFFQRQARLAAELDLPVNVHSRSAGHHAIAALVEAGARRVLMHAFDGRAGAELKGVSTEEVARVTTANAVRLFGEGLLGRCG